MSGSPSASSASLKRIALLLGPIIGVALLGWMGYQALYESKAAPRRATLAALDAQIDDVSTMLRRLTPTGPLRSAAAARMLPGSPAEVDHLLRTLLTESVRGAGLASVEIAPANARAAINPAAREMTRSLRASRLDDHLSQRDLAGHGRTFREGFESSPDFLVVRGTVRGAGTLKQVLAAAAAVDSQPWIHRIDSVAVAPQGRERQAFTLRIGFSTAFNPQLTANMTAPTGPSETDAATLESWLAFARPSPFVNPPSPPPPPRPDPPPAEVQPEPKPKPKPKPPYKDYRVAGILELDRPGESTGAEILILHEPSGRLDRRRPGQAVLEATIESATQEDILIRIGNDLFRVRLGDTLNRRERVEGKV